MMIEFDLSEVGKNGRDKFFGINLPSSLDTDLAYETGVQIGDGCLCSVNRLNPTRKVYNISYTGNINEFEYYEIVLKPLIKKLYGKDVTVRRYHRDNTCKIQFESMSIFLFKTKLLGLIQSPKDFISIPNTILKERELALNCLQGIADSDFCLCFLKRNKDVNYYPTLTAHLKSKILVEQIAEIIKSNLKINPTVLYGVKSLDKRTNKIRIHNQIELWGKKKLQVWMENVGFRNLRTIEKYKTWKNLGYLPKMPQ